MLKVMAISVERVVLARGSIFVLSLSWDVMHTLRMWAHIPKYDLQLPIEEKKITR